MKDTLGVNLMSEDIAIIIQFNSENFAPTNDYLMDSPMQKTHLNKSHGKMRRVDSSIVKSVQELPNLHNSQQKTYAARNNMLSPTSRYSEATRSTSFSRPFTSISFVSSTTLGSSLTQKIERMNKVTLKSVAKQLIQC